jgi:hypothetical protein
VKINAYGYCVLQKVKPYSKEEPTTRKKLPAQFHSPELTSQTGSFSVNHRFGIPSVSQSGCSATGGAGQASTSVSLAHAYQVSD